MQQTSDQKQLMGRFIDPLHNALDTCKHQRSCTGLSDLQWLQMGVERSLKECKTGRGFLQDWAMAHSENSVGVSHFFETLKSNRRLDLVKEVNTQVAASMPHMQTLKSTLLRIWPKSMSMLVMDTSIKPVPMNCRSKASDARLGTFIA